MKELWFKGNKKDAGEILDHLMEKYETIQEVCDSFDKEIVVLE